MDKNLRHKIETREIDINNQSLFFSTLIKGLVWNLHKDLTIRKGVIPHFFLNTGNDEMYLEVKGQDQSKAPFETINENYVYNSIPRCILDMSSIEVEEDQLTNPYTRGHFDMEVDEMIRGFNAEFRRLPIKLSVSLKYYLDTFTDMLELTQQILTHLIFIKSYKFEYMGHTITATYKVPTNIGHEKNITFDGGTTDSKFRIVSLDLEVETNLPVFDEKTVIGNEETISDFTGGIYDKEGNLGKYTFDSERTSTKEFIDKL